jgi:hypothetical protein
MHDVSSWSARFQLYRSPNISGMLLAKNNSTSVLAALFIGLTSILLFLPLLSVMPRPGLDTSFTLPPNEAVAQGMVFGRDIIYTIGPLASIWNQAYHPATIVMALIGGGFIGIGHAFVTYAISKNSHRSWVWVYVIFLIFLLESRDALFLVYPMLLSLLIYRISLASPHGDRIQLSKGESIWFAATVSSLGLLPLIRPSFLPLTSVVWMLGSILLWKSGRRLIAVSLILFPPISMVLFWTIAGQDTSALLDYCLNSAPIVSGYTQAMSTGTHFVTPVLFVVTSLLALLYFYQTRPSVSIHEYSFLLFMAVFLFMSFKAGFVRHDVHALTASSSLVMAAIVLGGLRTIEGKRLSIVFLISVALWIYIHIEEKSSKFEYYKPLSSQVRARLKAWSAGEVAHMSLEGRYNSGLADIRRTIPIPTLQGTVDIYQFEIAALIASGNKWSPRPVIQSYSAYTPNLAMVNADHLSGPKAPDNILFNVETIDNRYPSMDDGSSWPMLLAQYELSGATDRYLLLRKRAQPSPKPTMTPVFSKRVHLGEGVDTDLRGGIIYAKIEVTPSLFGRVANFLYKPTALKITVELSTDKKHQHRFVPGQAISGFILSPYISNKGDFSKMLQPGMINALPSVDRLTIEETPREIGLWNREYSITLYKLVVESNIAHTPPQRKTWPPWARLHSSPPPTQDSKTGG